MEFAGTGSLGSRRVRGGGGSTVANVGILYGPMGMGRYRIPLGQSIDDTISTALGYQRFLDGIDSQLIFEVGMSTKSGKEDGAVGFAHAISALSADTMYSAWIPSIQENIPLVF